MANTRELRRRIKSVKNTSQITKAMEMVAATKMRKAQSQALSGRPYNQTLNQALHRLGNKLTLEVHPFLKENKSDEVGLLLLTTDKSLCGALNTNLFRFCQNQFWENKSVKFFTVGKKGRNFVVKLEKKLEADFENFEVVTFQQAISISKILTDEFLNGNLKEVYILYPNFISTLNQEPKLIKLLPLTTNELELELNLEDKVNKTSKILNNSNNSEFLFEPRLDELLSYVLLHFIQTKIYQALLETKASEHSARMIAMQNATDNALELVDDLKLTYNQTRQDAITRELLEITSAGAALE